MGNPELMGWRGPDNIFICAHCAGRILARGCNLQMIASVPQYFPKGVDTVAAPVHQPCDFCSIQLHSQGAHPEISAVFDESQRQMIVLGLAVLTKRSPGFEWACGETADVLHARSMFDEFKTYNAHLGAAAVRLTDAMPADAATVASAAPDSSPLQSLRDCALELLREITATIPASRMQSALRAKASGLCNRIDALIKDAKAVPDPNQMTDEQRLHWLTDQALFLCHEIEKIPASFEQTNLSSAASETHMKVQQMWINRLESLRTLAKDLQDESALQDALQEEMTDSLQTARSKTLSPAPMDGNESVATDGNPLA